MKTLLIMVAFSTPANLDSHGSVSNFQVLQFDSAQECEDAGEATYGAVEKITSDIVNGWGLTKSMDMSSEQLQMIPMKWLCVAVLPSRATKTSPTPTSTSDQ